MENVHAMTELEWHSNVFEMPLEKCGASICNLAANGQNKVLVFNKKDLLASPNVKKNYCRNWEYTSFLQSISITWAHVKDLAIVLEIRKGENILYEIPESFEQTKGIAYIKNDV